MTEPDPGATEDLDTSPEAALPRQDRREHGGMAAHLDDDELALAAARERVQAGLEDYVPEDVPPAADPLPEGSSEAADLAQRGLLGDTTVDDEA